MLTRVGTTQQARSGCSPLGHSGLARFTPIIALMLTACPHGGLQEGASPLPAVTASASELTRITSDPLPEWNPRPSPDGKMLLFDQRDDAKSGNERFSVVRVDVGSPGRTLVSDVGSAGPAWFPDNKAYAYATTRTGVWRVVRSTAAGRGGGMTFLTSSPSGDGEIDPDVSADGKRIAFVAALTRDSVKNGKLVKKIDAPVLASIDVGSSNVTMYGAGSAPRWSPEGTSIAFENIDRGVKEIFLMDVGAGGQLTQLTTGPAYNIQPAWSPDAKWIAFVSNRDGDKTQHLYVMRSDGTQVTQLTRGKSIEETPGWSSDGYIYFSSNASGNFDIWRLKPVLQ